MIFLVFGCDISPYHKKCSKNFIFLTNFLRYWQISQPKSKKTKILVTLMINIATKFCRDIMTIFHLHFETDTRSLFSVNRRKFIFVRWRRAWAAEEIFIQSLEMKLQNLTFARSQLIVTLRFFFCVFQRQFCFWGESRFPLRLDRFRPVASRLMQSRITHRLQHP